MASSPSLTPRARHRVGRWLLASLSLAPFLGLPGCLGSATAWIRAETCMNISGFWMHSYESPIVTGLIVATALLVVTGCLVAPASRIGSAAWQRVRDERMPWIAAVPVLVGAVCWTASFFLDRRAEALFTAGYVATFHVGPAPPPGSWRAFGGWAYALFLFGWGLFLTWPLVWAARMKVWRGSAPLTPRLPSGAPR